MRTHNDKHHIDITHRINRKYAFDLIQMTVIKYFRLAFSISSFNYTMLSYDGMLDFQNVANVHFLACHSNELNATKSFHSNFYIPTNEKCIDRERERNTEK